MSDYRKQFIEETGAHIPYGKYSNIKYILWLEARLQKSEEREKIYKEALGDVYELIGDIEIIKILEQAHKKAGEIK